MSHGGAGNPRGHLTAPHLGTTLAAGGFLAVHVGHDRSIDGRRQVDDRPLDIGYVLDRLADGTISPPAGWPGTPDLDRVGHTGHSFGAYTAHAVAGATFERFGGGTRSYRDERIDAIAPISPQGPDQFGAFDRGADSTWSTVGVPVFSLVGGDEIDSNAVDSVVRPGWRLVPFDRYPSTIDAVEVVVAGQDHSDMWRTGDEEVGSFIADEILEFMRVYVARDPGADPCGIGVPDGDGPSTSLRRRAGTPGGLLSGCP